MVEEEGGQSSESVEASPGHPVESAVDYREVGVEKEVKLTEAKLTELLKAAAEAHHAYEQGTGKKDENWPAWYAKWIVEQDHSASSLDRRKIHH